MRLAAAGTGLRGKLNPVFGLLLLSCRDES